MIDEDSGVLTTSKAGAVQIVATVAETTTHSGATAVHALIITRLDNTLTLSSEGGGPLPGTVEVNGTHDFAATRMGTGAIRWGVTDTSNAATSLATIDPLTGVLTANGGGMVKVVANVEPDDVYAAISESHTLTLTLIPADITLTDSTTNLNAMDTYTFMAASTASGDSREIAWSVSDTDVATINPTTGVLTAVGAGSVDVIAVLQENTTHSRGPENPYADGCPPRQRSRPQRFATGYPGCKRDV